MRRTEHWKTPVLVLCTLLLACSEKQEFKDTTPTSGRLKVYYDEGLRLHIQNQVLTFTTLYNKAEVTLIESSENEAIHALLHDSCEAIMISRPLGEQEKKAFASSQYTPSFSPVAKSGIAIIAHSQNKIPFVSLKELQDLLLKNAGLKDSMGVAQQYTVLFDKNNSSVLHYVLDSLLKSRRLSDNCRILESTLESINYVASNKNALALIDFAWISDVDDSIVKANKALIKTLPVLNAAGNAEFPDQSSFKLGTYPLSRTVYIYRKTGEFTLAKGFESFVAGPKGQLTFLKQGLLPIRQPERSIQVNMEGERE